MFNRKQLARLIWPLIVEQFLAVAIGMADTVMVTSCGEAAVAGVSLVDSINVLLINIFSALATGGAILASQYIGRQDKEQANVAAKQLVLVTAGISVLVMAICLFANASLLHMVFGEAEADVMTNAETYFFWSALSYPFLALYNAGAALFRAMGNSRISMFTALLMNALNIGGNALLIYGMNMGVAGAGHRLAGFPVCGSGDHAGPAAAAASDDPAGFPDPAGISSSYDPADPGSWGSPTAWRTVCSRSAKFWCSG